MTTTSRPIDFFTIIGVGRSGTSLLMTMLDSHPELAMPPESQFIFRHLSAKPGASCAELRQRIEHEEAFGRLGFDLDQYLQPFTSGARPFSMAAAYQRVFELWGEQTGRHKIGDKSPKNIEYLPIVKAVYPDARIVHIVRDPRDVFLSRSKAKWCAGRSRLAQTLAYRAQYDMARELGPRLFGDHYVEIHYEQLVQSPATELVKVCAVLGVPYDERMLARSESAQTHVFSHELEWKREVLGPLLKSNFNKWAQELTPAEIAYIEDCCSTSFAAGGYEPAPRSAGWLASLQRYWNRAEIGLAKTAYQAYISRRNRQVIRLLESQPGPASAATGLADQGVGLQSRRPAA